VSGPRITVGVATCGRPEGLARCLAGLLEQTEPAFEIVVVDQAPGAAARAGSAQAGARYVEQERRGLSASRNRALVECTGDVLAVTDDDCVPDPGWIAGLAAALTREPAPAAVSGPILPPRGEQPPGTYAISLRESEAPVDHAGGVPPWQAGSGANFAAAAERLRALGGWDERLGTGSPGRAAEDADLLYRLLRDGGTVRYEPTAVVRHAHAASSDVRSRLFRFHDDRNRLLMLTKNAPAGLALRSAARYPLTVASLTLRQGPGAAMTTTRLRALASYLRLLPRMLRRRRSIARSAVVPPSESVALLVAD